MRLTNRNSLALFYSSFVFGSLAVPYYYVALGILIPNPLTIMLQIFLLLAASTTLLLLTLITRTRVEQVLANRLGRFFRPLLVAAVIIAAVLSWQIELAIASSGANCKSVIGREPAHPACAPLPYRLFP